MRLFSYLNTRHNHQGRRYGDGEGLLVGEVGAVLLHHDGEGSERNEEEQEGGAHALQRAQEELPLVEEEVLLARLVQVRVAQAVLVVDVLQENTQCEARQDRAC